MKTVFLDMDGVVADFDALAQCILNIDVAMPLGYKYPQADWDKLKLHERFYRDIPLVSGAKEFVTSIVDITEKNNTSVKFLTAVPSGNDMPWAFSDKISWANNHFPNIPVWFGPYSDDKHLRAGEGNILIDDRIKNITTWEASGGIGILFTGNFLETLSCLMDKFHIK